VNPQRAPRGQILVIVAGGIVVLTMAVGLVIDSGIGFMNRRDAQNISDLGSMAGTKEIADHYLAGGRTGTQVYDAIEASVTANGCTGTCTWGATYVAGDEADLSAVVSAGAIPANAQGVRLVVQRHPETFFMRVIGMDSLNVATTATAVTARSTTAPPGVLLPIAMSPPDPMIPGDTYDITDGTNGPGNFGWLTWTGANDANTLTASVCTPNNPELTVPLNVEGLPGKKNKAELRACLDEYIANGTTVVIPIWDGSDVGNGSNSTYHIIGFAAFTLTWHSQPAVDNIQGVFHEFYPLLTVPAGFGTQPIPGDATHFIGLVR
jgi:hypothetical protein